jgi:hypothetical protein
MAALPTSRKCRTLPTLALKGKVGAVCCCSTRRAPLGPRKPQDSRSLFRLHPRRDTRRGHS